MFTRYDFLDRHSFSNTRYEKLFPSMVAPYLPLYELVEGDPARVTVLAGRHGLDDGQRFQLLPDHVLLEAERFVGQRGPQATDEVHPVLVFGRVGQRPEYFHAAGPVHGRRSAHASRLRILAARFGVVLLRKGHTHTHKHASNHLFINTLIEPQ